MREDFERISNGKKQVKVKIAVAVDPGGNWNASGWLNLKNGEPELGDAMGSAIDSVAQGEKHYQLTAWLDIPGEPEEIEGEME